MVRFLEIQGPNCCEILHRPSQKESNPCFFFKEKEKRKPEGEGAPVLERPSLPHPPY